MTAKPLHSSAATRLFPLRLRAAVLFMAAILCLASIPLAWASVAGSISGVVRDSSGATVPGVQVVANEKATGVKTTVTTDSDGYYKFQELPIGTYDVEIGKTGFKTYVKTNLVLEVNDALTIDATLSVGSTGETVNVEANAVHVETTSSQMGEVITGDAMTAVPLVTRSYTDLLALQPGVVAQSSGLAGGQGGQFSATGFQFTPISGELNAGNQSVNGQRESANAFILNGMTVQEFAFSGTAIIPNLDSIAEFRIITNNFDAEYGDYAGGQINVVTKSGTNRLHGSGFDFLRNTDLDARSFGAQLRDTYQKNEFGGTLGGPIRKDKLFFFADYQGNRVITGVSALGANQIPVPTNAERSGDFSAQAAAGDFSQTINNQTVPFAVRGPFWAQTLSSELGYTVTQGEPYYQPGCTTATCVFPGAQIPASVTTVPSTNLLKFIPPVTTVDSSGNAFFVPSSEAAHLGDNKTSGRLDDVTRLGLLSAYYFYDEFRQVTPNIFLPGFGSNNYGRSQMVGLGDSKSFSSSSLNEIRAGFTRLYFVMHTPTGGDGVTPGTLGFVYGPGTLGISPSVPANAHVPNIGFNNFSFGASGSALGVTENTWQILDNYSKVIGTHTITLGGQFRYNQMVEYNLGSNGNFNFNGSETGIDFADFLIGAPQSYSQGQGFPSYGRSRYFGAFAQDSWRVRPKLTINYGLRWDVSRPWSEEHNELETLIPGEQSLVYPGSPTGWVFPGDPHVPSSLAPTRYDNFAPRIGLAYAINDKTSFRAGWGKFYTTFEGASNFNEIGDAPFGDYYGSPVPPQFVTPYIDRGTGNHELQPFPVAPPPASSSPSHPDNSINWAADLPIGTSPAFYYKNVLPYTEQYEASVERQLTGATVVTASYVGSQGHNLLSSLQANPGNSALCLSVSQLSEVVSGTSTCGPNGENGVYNPVGGGVINGTRGPYGPNFESEGYFVTDGFSDYNSLQLSLKHRTRRLQTLVGYTYSKSMDNASGYGEQVNFENTHQKALSAFNNTQNFVVSYNYDLPIDLLHGPSRLVKGWRVSGITRFSTGLPVTLWESDDNSLTGTSGAGAISLPIDRPEYTPGSLNFTNLRSGQPYFNTGLFSPEPLGQLGNSSRRFFAGPGINNWDIAIMKDTAIKEGINLEFRAELFNAFNHAQFDQIDGNVDDGHLFGTWQSVNAPRIMQVSLKLLF
jgi:Carboxypeptidase regulatory-like domain